MSVTTGLWLVRHAPVIDPEGRDPARKAYGHLDVSADVSDSAWLARVADCLPPDALWITSHLKRTKETAAALREIMTPRPDSPVAEDPDLAEQHFGHWQGLGYEAIATWQDEQSERFWANPAREPPPGGESFESQLRRTTAAIDRLLHHHGGREIVVVVHGGTIRAALGRAMELTPEQALAFEVDNLSITHLRHIEPDPAEAKFLTARGVWRVHVTNLSLRYPDFSTRG